MLYLIKGKAIDNVVAGPPEQMVSVLENLAIPSYKILADGEHSKKFTGGAIAGRRAWAIIGEFPNNEEVNKWVMSLPFWTVQTVKITPLVAFQSQVEGASKLLQNVKAMAKK